MRVLIGDTGSIKHFSYSKFTKASLLNFVMSDLPVFPTRFLCYMVDQTVIVQSFRLLAQYTKLKNSKQMTNCLTVYSIFLLAFYTQDHQYYRLLRSYKTFSSGYIIPGIVLLIKILSYKVHNYVTITVMNIFICSRIAECGMFIMCMIGQQDAYVSHTQLQPSCLTLKHASIL